MKRESKRIRWFLLPFWLIWKFTTAIVEFTGRIVAIVLGFGLMAVGLLLSATIVGLIIGLPMILIGVLLVLRGIF